jgi:hypothetical protein
LTFKGGTSLSKAYKIIDRFSEDIDLTYDIRKLIADLVTAFESATRRRAATNPTRENRDMHAIREGARPFPWQPPKTFGHRPVSGPIDLLTLFLLPFLLP